MDLISFIKVCVLIIRRNLDFKYLIEDDGGNGGAESPVHRVDRAPLTRLLSDAVVDHMPPPTCFYRVSGFEMVAKKIFPDYSTRRLDIGRRDTRHARRKIMYYNNVIYNNFIIGET